MGEKIKIIDTGTDRNLTKKELEKLRLVCDSIERRIKSNRVVTMEIEVDYKNCKSKFAGQYLGDNRFVLWIPGGGIRKWNMDSLISVILHELGHWDEDIKGLNLKLYTEDEDYADSFAKKHLLAKERFIMNKTIQSW